jgi:BirA family biotin operon repressor/biotin-[acetyl-CoA-carboxylase] ligase
VTARVLHFDRVDSTNAEAHRLAAGGERGPVWIVADEQTAGRGRLGRAWVSNPGNLYATHLLTVPGGPALASQLSFVAALAMFDAVAKLRGAGSLALKWPNDVLLAGRKCSGILVETLGSGNVWTTAAAGFGLNLASAPEAAAYPVAALGADVSPEQAFMALQGAFEHWCGRWQAGAGFSGIREAWFDRAIGKNSAVTVSQGAEVLSGRFAGLGEDGALLLADTEGRMRSIHAGDVTFAELQALRGAA